MTDREIHALARVAGCRHQIAKLYDHSGGDQQLNEIVNATLDQLDRLAAYLERPAHGVPDNA